VKKVYYFCTILTRYAVGQHSLVKILYVKFHDNLSKRNPHGQTWPSYLSFFAVVLQKNVKRSLMSHKTLRQKFSFYQKLWQAPF